MIDPQKRTQTAGSYLLMIFSNRCNHYASWIFKIPLRSISLESFFCNISFFDYTRDSFRTCFSLGEIFREKAGGRCGWSAFTGCAILWLEGAGSVCASTWPFGRQHTPFHRIPRFTFCSFHSWNRSLREKKRPVGEGAHERSRLVSFGGKFEKDPDVPIHEEAGLFGLWRLLPAVHPGCRMVLAGGRSRSGSSVDQGLQPGDGPVKGGAVDPVVCRWPV